VYKRQILQHFAALPSHERLEQRYQEPSLWDSFLHYLQLNGYAIPSEQIGRDVTQSLVASPAIQTILITVYRQNPLVSNLCERLIDLDEGFQEWRYRHVKMVERTIGMKQGTGGSSGAAYLASTIKPFFPDLWAIRADL